MLHDEQKFHVDGKSKEDLEATLELLLKLSGTGAKAYSYVEGEGEVVYYFYPAPKPDLSKLPDVKNAKILADLAWEVLQSGKDNFKQSDDFDGTVRLGWEVYTNNNYLYDSFTVKLAWLYYGK